MSSDSRRGFFRRAALVALWVATGTIADAVRHPARAAVGAKRKITLSARAKSGPLQAGALRRYREIITRTGAWVALPKEPSLSVLDAGKLRVLSPAARSVGQVLGYGSIQMKPVGDKFQANCGVNVCGALTTQGYSEECPGHTTDDCDNLNCTGNHCDGQDCGKLDCDTHSCNGEDCGALATKIADALTSEIATSFDTPFVVELRAQLGIDAAVRQRASAQLARAVIDFVSRAGYAE